MIKVESKIDFDHKRPSSPREMVDDENYNIFDSEYY
jgi:hypothetical protein